MELRNSEFRFWQDWRDEFGKVTGVIKKGDEYLAVIDGKRYKAGMTFTVRYFDREWTPAITAVESNGIRFSLAGASETLRAVGK